MANALQMVSNPNLISLEKLAAAFHAIHGGYHRLDESHCPLLHMPRHKFWTKIIKKKGGGGGVLQCNVAAYFSLLYFLLVIIYHHFLLYFLFMIISIW